MTKLSICSVLIILFTNCRNTKSFSASVQVDTLSAKIFLSGRNVCELATAKNFKKINPQMVPWATDPKDPYSESYFIGRKKLVILQPLKRFDLPDSNRRYIYDGRPLKTIRVIFDSLDFNFNKVTFDYGNSAENIYQDGNRILLRNEPIDWTGTANRYRFVQLFDLGKMVCYEFFVDYYSCAPDSSYLK